jgi:integrase/recombinase XerD
MLDGYFKAPWGLRHRRSSGPLGPHLEGLAAFLHDRGYARRTVREVVWIVSRWGRYLEKAGIRHARHIEEDLAHRFLRRLAAVGPFRYGPRAVRLMLEHLRRQKIVPAVERRIPRDIFGPLLKRYERYLAAIRGLVPSTRRDYCHGARRLLGWVRTRRRRIRDIRGQDILGFIARVAVQHSSRSWRNRITTHTRAFLRFLRWTGILDRDFARVVPKLPCWQLASVPRHLPWQNVRRLIDSIDTRTPTGKRDKAVVLLIAALGMRGEEVRALELAHLEWRAGEIRLPRTKARRAKVLPVPGEVGAAVADYLLHGRPQSHAPHVFLRHAAPRDPLTSPASVSRIVTRCLRRAQIATPERPGVHLLRHSLATRMVNTGVPIKQIADVLGHRSINTTAIYTKVDMARLVDVALPFPRDGRAR